MSMLQRGNKRRTPLGTALFVTLRALDPVLQYGILSNGIGAGLLGKIGLKTVADGPRIQSGISLIDGLQLSPYRLLLLTMATGSAIKQIFWLLYTSQEAFPVSIAIPVSVFNTTINSINSLLATTTLAGSVSGLVTQPSIIVGSCLYFVGIFTEALAEVQRKFFKREPKNLGKPCTNGFWSITRHINYTGYLAWRTGYGLVAGGLPTGIIQGGFFVQSFIGSSIPELDAYATKRYGEQWESYKKKTPYTLIPGII